MNYRQFFFSYLFLIITANLAQAQEDKKDAYLNEPIDSTLSKAIQLDEILIDKTQNKVDAEAIKRFQILQRRVYKVYPYAKTGAERLVLLNKGLTTLKTNSERKKYFKIIENYMTNEFEKQLKNLSRKDGQILVKLIHRQTGSTTFDLIKNLKSGWKAFWSNNTAKLFDINLKTKYEPLEVNEDYLIETILVRAFQNGLLVKQDSAIPIDYTEVAAFWQEKLSKPKAK
jgi:ABC-type transporter MlaC component